MKKFTLTSYEQYKRIRSIISVVFLLFLILFTFAFFKIIYSGVASKEYTKFSYGLFAANAIICNSLLAFGRSPVFIDRFDKNEQKLIYISAAMFLYAAIIGFFVSGWIYVNTDKDFAGNALIQNSSIGHQFILVSLSIGLGISVLFTISGLIFFYKWSNKAIGKVSDELKENNEKEIL